MTSKRIISDHLDSVLERVVPLGRKIAFLSGSELRLFESGAPLAKGIWSPNSEAEISHKWVTSILEDLTIVLVVEVDLNLLNCEPFWTSISKRAVPTILIFHNSDEDCFNSEILRVCDERNLLIGRESTIGPWKALQIEQNRLANLESRRIGILSCAGWRNFGDRLGFHLLNRIIPPEVEVFHCFYPTMALPPGHYDMLILCLGTSLFHRMLDARL